MLAKYLNLEIFGEGWVFDGYFRIGNSETKYGILAPTTYNTDLRGKVLARPLLILSRHSTGIREQKIQNFGEQECLTLIVD